MTIEYQIAEARRQTRDTFTFIAKLVVAALILGSLGHALLTGHFG